MSIYPTVPLTDVAWFQEGPGILAKDFTSEGIPLVRLSGLGGHEVTLRGCNHVSQDKGSSKWAHFRLGKGDILVSTSASFGRPAVVGEEADGALFYTGLIRFRSRSSDLDEGYLKTFLGSRLFMRQAEAMASGSVIQHFGPSHLRKMHVHLPPLPTQQAIASIHSAVDDKIESNRKLNEALLQMARVIFRDWFIDFGPTRAKVEGGEPYLEATLWDKFPAKFGEDGIPKGWTTKPLDTVADFLNGLALQKYPPTGADDLPVIKIAQLRAGDTTGAGQASRTIPSKYVVDDGDVLFSWSGTLTQVIWTGGIGALNQHLFKVSSANHPKWMHYLWVDHHLPAFQAIAAAKATTMGHIQRHHLTEAMATIADEDIMNAADAVLAPLLEKVLANALESRSLATTRDLVLPMLMSGDVPVGDVETMLAEAA